MISPSAVRRRAPDLEIPETAAGTVSRRTLLASSAAAMLAGGAFTSSRDRSEHPAAPAPDTVPFFGEHQAGVVTPPQAHLSFAAFDLSTVDVRQLRRLLITWSNHAAALTLGQDLPGPETRPARLTITIGLGPGVFDGRFGLQDHRPPALRPLPAFAGDLLDPVRCGGDLMVQACSDDSLVAFHAVRRLAAAARGVARTRWQQQCFLGSRNLFGFRDGTANPLPGDPDTPDLVWVQSKDGPEWLTGGSYLAVRRIRMNLDAWDATPVSVQEESVGRRKATGGPLSGGGQQEPVDLDLRGLPGRPLVAADAHVRRARVGPGMLRRGYSYDDGWDAAAGSQDAGLLFLAYVRDLDAQFLPVQRALATNDRMSTFTSAVASAVFAVPAGARGSGYVGESLLN